MLKEALLRVSLGCVLSSVCVCVFVLFFSFMYRCVCLTCCLFTQPSMPRPAFGTSLGLVKMAHFPTFPFFFVPSFLPSYLTVHLVHHHSLRHHHHLLLPLRAKPEPSPLQTTTQISNSLTNLPLRQTHTNTRSITNPKLAPPQKTSTV